MALIPAIGRVRLLRSWGGIMDMSMDGSPIIDHTPIEGLYLNAGWCYGGFKATPASGWCFAHLLARDEPHEVARAYRLDRFANGRLLDEKGMGAAAQPALKSRHGVNAYSMSFLRRAGCQRIQSTSAMRLPAAGSARHGGCRRALLRSGVPARQSRGSASRSCGITAAVACWLRVNRNTRTHEILAVPLAGKAPHS